MDNKISDKTIEEKLNILKDLTDRIEGKKSTKPTKEEAFEILDSLGLIKDGKLISNEELEKQLMESLPKISYIPIPEPDFSNFSIPLDRDSFNKIQSKLPKRLLKSIKIVD